MSPPPRRSGPCRWGGARRGSVVLVVWDPMALQDASTRKAFALAIGVPTMTWSCPRAPPRIRDMRSCFSQSSARIDNQLARIYEMITASSI